MSGRLSASDIPQTKNPRVCYILYKPGGKDSQRCSASERLLIECSQHPSCFLMYTHTVRYQRGRRLVICFLGKLQYVSAGSDDLFMALSQQVYHHLCVGYTVYLLDRA